VTQAAQSPAGWNADPFGRYQWRYWDGTQWTDQVASNGQQATDPPTGEIVPPDRAVFEAPSLVVVYVGDEADAGWPVYAGDEKVAVVAVGDKFLGPDDYFLTDATGRALLMVRSTRNVSDPGYLVLDPAGGMLGLVGGMHMNTNRTSKYDVVDAARQRLGMFELTTSRLTIDGGVVTDPAGGEIARLSQGKESTGFLQGRAWLTLERDPALADPLPTLLVGGLLGIYDDLHQRTRPRKGRHGGGWSPL
jgi:Protein of unknown function (DUF2510)